MGVVLICSGGNRRRRRQRQCLFLVGVTFYQPSTWLSADKHIWKGCQWSWWHSGLFRGCSCLARLIAQIWGCGATPLSFTLWNTGLNHFPPHSNELLVADTDSKCRDHSGMWRPGYYFVWGFDRDPLLDTALGWGNRADIPKGPYHVNLWLKLTKRKKYTWSSSGIGDSRKAFTAYLETEKKNKFHKASSWKRSWNNLAEATLTILIFFFICELRAMVFINTFVLIANSSFLSVTVTARQSQRDLSSGLRGHLAASASVFHVQLVSSHCAAARRQHPQYSFVSMSSLRGPCESQWDLLSQN